jgi:mannosyltransferase
VTINTEESADRTATEAAPTTAAPAAEPQHRVVSVLTRTVWLWPALLTFTLGVWGSWRPTLWRDELASWSAASRSTGELFGMLGHVDAVSGAYYLMLHGWISVVGDSPALIRLPSAVAMAGAAVFVALTARKLFGPWTALTAGLLFSVVPSVSRYAQEARVYAFVVLAVAAATWLLLRVLERPSLARLAPYGLSVALAGVFHMVSLVFLCAHAAIVAMYWRRTGQRRLLWAYPVTVAVSLLPLLPLVVLGRKQVGRQISWLHSPDLANVVDHWHGLFASALVSMCVLACAAIPAGWSRGRWPAFAIGLTAFLPLVVTWFASQGHSSYYLDRYQLYTVPAWCVLAAAGLTSLRPRALGAVGLAVVALAGVQDQQHLRTSTSHENTNGRAAAAVIAKGYQPGDGIVPVRGSQAWMMIDLETAYYLPRSVHPKDVFAEQSAVQHDDLYTVPCPDPAACLGDTKRIWLVTLGSDDPYHELSAKEAAALQADFVPAQVTHVRGLTVSLLERRG